MGLRARLTLLLVGGGIYRPFLWAKNESGPFDEDRYWRQSGSSGRLGASQPEVTKTSIIAYLTDKIKIALRRSLQAQGPWPPIVQLWYASA